MHDVETVAFAVIVTGAGHVTVNPVTGLATSLRLTVPAKLSALVRETLTETPDCPTFRS